MLVFEILEDEYGQMNEQALENIRFIKNELHAKIAIDDYHDEGEASMGNISADILWILDEEKLLPDFIKIDGKTVRWILDNTINVRYIAHLRELIQQYSLQNTEFIFEWVQNTEEALKIEKLFQIYKNNASTQKITEWVKFSYQWEKLKEYHFGTRYLTAEIIKNQNKQYA